MNALTPSPLAHFALRTIERIAIGILLGLLLWAVTAQAQDTAPEFPGPPPAPITAPELPGRPAAQLILKSDSLRLIGSFGQEVFAIADDGTVELSGTATIDFSPSMRTSSVGSYAGALRVRVGGRLYTLQLFDDAPCTTSRCAR